ncbi:hypothetical protein MMC14_008313 [Varicellaria rhodocarpa]|nr:hypothetical protein [Varicellaria rhodocarpa]
MVRTIGHVSQRMETPALDKHCKAWAKPKPYTTYDHGLEAVTSDRHPCGDQYRAIWGLSNLAGYQDLIDESVEGVGDADGIRKFIGVLEAEMKRGASFNTTFLCVVGRKTA